MNARRVIVVATTIYFIAENSKDGPGFSCVKIGYTGQTSVYRRLDTLQTANPQKLTLLFDAPGTRPKESFLHSFFRPFKVRGEWFRPEKRLMEFIDHCKKQRKIDLAHLAPCTWVEKNGRRSRSLKTCLWCAKCDRPGGPSKIIV